MTYKVFIEIGKRKLAIEVEADSELEAREVKIHKVEPVTPKTKQDAGVDYLKNIFNIK